MLPFGAPMALSTEEAKDMKNAKHPAADALCPEYEFDYTKACCGKYCKESTHDSNTRRLAVRNLLRVKAHAADLITHNGIVIGIHGPREQKCGFACGRVDLDG